MKRVAFYTLGCKLNQSETATIAEEFARRGYQIVNFGQPADVYFINTCSVTERADRKCRQAVRKAIESAPQARVIVGGCYAQLHSEDLCRIEGVDLILGTKNKFNVFDYLPEIESDGVPLICVEAFQKDEPFRSPRAGLFWDHTRAFLKIQEGCDFSCSYCSVPLSRGPSRSGPPELIVRQAQELIQRGVKEIVLTGVHIGAYGQDLPGRENLVTLLQRLIRIPGLRRLRLSSIDPGEIEDELIDLVAGNPILCPHFHIPLQSGDDEILRRMNRPYRAAHFQEVIWKIAGRIPDVCIGTDIIVGFPGEEDRHFQNTYRLVEELPLAYFHVFPYSRRERTPAAHFPNQVDEKIKKQRGKILRELGARKRQQFGHRFLNRTVEVLVETRDDEGYTVGLSGNYLRIRWPEEAPANELVKVRITRIDGEKLYGRLCKG